MAYSICKRTGLALIKLNNPPVNGLGHSLRIGIARGLDSALKDKCPAVVISGEAANFSAGADIAEFSSGGHLKSPSLNEVISLMDGYPLPIVAGIDGACLGGGMELALGCHWRVAGPKTKMGLPEVHLGLLPGAGGTQRLPRIVGVPKAVDLIVSGRHVSPKEAFALGIVDHIATGPGHVIESAIDFAVSTSVTSTPVEDRRVSGRTVPGDTSDALFEKLRSDVQAAARGFVAPLSILEAIRWSAHASSFKEGMQKEGQGFAQLSAGSQARALQYFFFSERKATAPPSNGGEIKPVKSAGVIGGGTMGAGIAMCLAQANIPTTLVETTDQKAREATLRIEKTYKSSSAYKSGKQTDADVAAIMKNITTVGDDFTRLKDADIVIEAVFENMAIKKDIFSKLDKVCKPDTILASNTSYLDIDEIGQSTSRPANVVGTHFFSPANVMKLLEVVKGTESSPTAIATSMTLGKRIGKTTVLAGNCFGFIGNRMLSPYSYEAGFLLEEGCSPSQVDAVLKNEIGMAMGPFEMGDLAGNDVSWRIRQQVGLTTGNATDRIPNTRWDSSNPRYSSLADKLCEAGYFGQKAGRGWYKYDPKNPRKPIEDEETLALLKQHRQDVRIEARNIRSHEIIERCLYSLVNEGFKILEEGIASNPEDIDVVYIYGYGFPKYRGGPIWWAEKEIGLANVLTSIKKQHEQAPDLSWWVPSKLMEDCVAAGTSAREELHFRKQKKLQNK